MNHSVPIHWNGALVGHLWNVEDGTVAPLYGNGKTGGQWQPLETEIARAFVKEAEEHDYVDVTLGDMLPNCYLLFRLGLHGDAWLLLKYPGLLSRVTAF